MVRLYVVALTLGLVACEMPDMGEPTDGGDVDLMEGVPDSGRPPIEGLRVNQMQMRATVNSYHEIADDLYPEWAYRHPRPEVQLGEQGIRAFDFDLIGDRGGWLAIQPGTNELTIDQDNNCGVWGDGEMRSGNLVGCLWGIRDWSRAHPDHPLLVVLVGETHIGDLPPQLMWQLDDLDDELLVGLDRERLLTPADIRGEHATVWDAIEADGWPAVDETRGKVMVVLNDRGPTRVAYLMNGGLDPDDQLMFVVGDPTTAGDPAVGDEVVFTFEPQDLYGFETDMARTEEMERLVQRGFLVHAITDNPRTAERLSEIGVHLIGTRFPMDVFGPVDGLPVRCNPATAPRWCRAEDLERAP